MMSCDDKNPEFSDNSAYFESEEEDAETSGSEAEEEAISLNINNNQANLFSTSQRVDYQILSETDLLAELNKTAQDASAIIRYSPSICRTLLHHFKWSSETLLEKYYESTDLIQFFKSANLLNPQNGLMTSDKTKVCRICYEMKILVGLQCGHLFCRDCWALYLTHKVEDEGRPFIACAEHKCDYILDDDYAIELINNEQISVAYQKLVLNSYVASNQLLRWCPGTNCGRAVKVPHSESRPISCECGFTFCFECIQQWHEPVSCKLLKLWLNKCSDDSETSNWLNANTKDCPKCHVTIEKDGGCNHMTCKNVSCKYEFCWTCLGQWGPHGSIWYACNRFDDSAAQKARDEQGRSRAALQRYLHYYNRYSNHQNSLKLEHKLYTSVALKIEQMQQHDFSWIETQFLKKAVDVLSECRKTLMYTYAFAFYLNQSNMSEIFEENQRDLEFATEELSGFLEKDLETEDLVTLKQKVQDKYRYVEQRRITLLKHCTEGYEANQWSFNEVQDHLLRDNSQSTSSHRSAKPFTRSK